MKNNPFSRLNKFERLLWCGSMLLASAAFLISGSSDVLSLIASLTGATALIFVAKGEVLGQILTVVFAVLYAILSWNQRYYGEMITYLGMSAPIAAMSVVSWLRHPYRDSAEVEVHQLTGRQKIVMLVMTAVTTFAFYYILRAFGTASLPMSTVSVATSFLASYLMFFRNPHYALAYAANDLVLIILWVRASVKDPACISVVACFAMFLANDLYGFVNWRRMQVRQAVG